MPTPEAMKMKCSDCGRFLKMGELPAEERVGQEATTELDVLFTSHRAAHRAAMQAGWLLGVVAPNLDLCPGCGPESEKEETDGC